MSFWSTVSQLTSTFVPTAAPEPSTTVTRTTPTGSTAGAGKYTDEAKRLQSELVKLKAAIDKLPANDPKRAELEHAYEAGEMALMNLTFSAQPGQALILPPGWAAVTDPKALARLGLSPADLNNPTTGYQAAVFYNKNTKQYTYANRGSNDPQDWLNNGTQAAGAGSPQYDQAIKNAIAINKASGGRVVFTGQSLGGGLASAQAFETGRRGITFNAAGLNASSLSAAAQQRLQNNPSLVQAYYVSGEPLHLAQSGLAPLLSIAWKPFGNVPPAAGQQIRLPGVDGLNPLSPTDLRYAHGMGGVATSLSQYIESLTGGTATPNPAGGSTTLAGLFNLLPVN
jgi:hypothetical protein